MSFIERIFSLCTNLARRETWLNYEREVAPRTQLSDSSENYSAGYFLPAKNVLFLDTEMHWPRWIGGSFFYLIYEFTESGEKYINFRQEGL